MNLENLNRYLRKPRRQYPDGQFMPRSYTQGIDNPTSIQVLETIQTIIRDKVKVRQVKDFHSSILESEQESVETNNTVKFGEWMWQLQNFIFPNNTELTVCEEETLNVNIKTLIDFLNLIINNEEEFVKKLKEERVNLLAKFLTSNYKTSNQIREISPHTLANTRINGQKLIFILIQIGVISQESKTLKKTDGSYHTAIEFLTTLHEGELINAQLAFENGFKKTYEELFIKLIKDKYTNIKNISDSNLSDIQSLKVNGLSFYNFAKYALKINVNDQNLLDNLIRIIQKYYIS